MHFLKSELLPRVVEANRHESFDPEIMLEMGELGLLGATVSPDYGGAGENYRAMHVNIFDVLSAAILSLHPDIRCWLRCIWSGGARN